MCQIMYLSMCQLCVNMYPMMYQIRVFMYRLMYPICVIMCLSMYQRVLTGRNLSLFKAFTHFDVEMVQGKGCVEKI